MMSLNPLEDDSKLLWHKVQYSLQHSLFCDVILEFFWKAYTVEFSNRI